MAIHSTAIVAKGAKLAADVEVGPYAVIGPEVTIGAGTRIGASAVIQAATVLGENCLVEDSTVLGKRPRLRKSSSAAGTEIGALVIGDGVTVCCGATECMMATMLALVDPGDEVVIFQPFYENYGPDAIISGAKPVWVPLRPPQEPGTVRHAQCLSGPLAV